MVAATDAEVAPIRSGTHARRGIDFLLTGVGMVGTAAHVSRALALDSYDVALNVGVCGSFVASIPPGTVVHVTADRIAELGAEDGDAFLTIEQLRLTGENSFANARPPVSAALERLPKVSAITVNTVHGCERSIADVVSRFQPDVESMEGAGFMCACALSRTIHAQVRAVSNMVERRNRAGWKLSEAIDNLSATVNAILDEL